MNTRARILFTAIALAAAAAVHAQGPVDRSFTASGTTCADVNWSAEMIAKYPKIGSACQEVMQRNGETYVKFQGDVSKVARGGREITVHMKGSDTHVVLNPDPDNTVFIGDRETTMKSLRPGDSLTFYVPEGRVVAAVMQSPTSPVEEIPIAPPVETMAMTSYQAPLPHTASSWPLLALLGTLLLGLASGIRAHKLLRGR
ncbi:MAG TPA: hypothetical protein VFS13_13175 [Steroidobacteraceae bacterium]|jgi:hypothetical protein|nr:hypothetical protein [Steroidobacteraceae bacterium]